MKYNNFVINKYTFKLLGILNFFYTNHTGKMLKFFCFIQFFTNQKPFLKKVCFKNLKKKILKRYIFILNLRKKSFLNFLNFLKFYYFYFYQICYSKPFKRTLNASTIDYCLINPYSFYKNYKLNYKFCLKISSNKNNNKAIFQLY